MAMYIGGYTMMNNDEWKYPYEYIDDATELKTKQQFVKDIAKEIMGEALDKSHMKNKDDFDKVKVALKLHSLANGLRLLANRLEDGDYAVSE